ncbi:MAG: UDP-N-acetylmuramoyl-L-alanyl-D-glutamate--2,6-diaminopimelate ligase [Gammaproteobacteria bacterium]
MKAARVHNGTMLLSELLDGFAFVAEDTVLTGLSLDSRTLTAGNLFIAMSGSVQHGLMHAEQAIRNGASAILFDPAGDGKALALQVGTLPLIGLENLGGQLGRIAARFYRDPSRRLNVIGFTGTNGKTSSSQFLSQVLDDCGIIGTLGWGEWGRLSGTLNTTPDAVTVQQILDEMAMGQKQSVAMEVSSHGLEQGRVNGVDFKGAVLTNISRDHLDYHGTMEAYVQAKLTLFERPELSFAVVNVDDGYCDRFIAAVPSNATVWGYSASGKRAVKGNSLAAANIRHGTDGVEFDVHWGRTTYPARIPLYGDFNIGNVLSVIAVMLALGHSLEETVSRLASVKPVAGRMERFGGGSSPVVFVDYAHTPDAIDKVLSSVKKHCNSGLWIVFGCGGDRDRGKRAEMGACAELWADHVIITDDNPRKEDGQAIVNDILKGCRSDKTEVIRNREKAIQSAIMRAGESDCIVIAGKGHEQYQEINGVRTPFSDVEAVTKVLNMRVNQNASVVE